MNTFQKYFQYVYLVLAVLFIYKGIEQVQNNESYWFSFLFGALAIVMFFFKRNFAKKFEQRNK